MMNRPEILSGRFLLSTVVTLLGNGTNVGRQLFVLDSVLERIITRSFRCLVFFLFCEWSKMQYRTDCC